MPSDAGEEETVDRRVFISGISREITKDELQHRLESYGSLTRDVELNFKNADTTGIFAHCGLSLTHSQWDRLRKLSGAVLKGSKLLVEESKPDYTTRIAIRDAKPDPSIPNPRKRPPRDTIPAVESRKVRRGELIKDNDITQKSRSKGWIKGRYGRAIAVLKIDGHPSLKRNPDALSKLWGTAHPTSDQLTSWYDDDFEEWYDRRGRLIKCPVIAKRRKPVELTAAGRVEIWDSDDDPVMLEAAEDMELEDMSEKGKTVDANQQMIDEADIDAQLVYEHTLGMAVLDDLLKGMKDVDVQSTPQTTRSKRNDRLDIVPRYDPNAPDSSSESDVEMLQSERNPSPVVEFPGSNEQIPDENEIHSRAMSPELLQNVSHRVDQVKSSDLTAIFQSRAEAVAEPFRLFASEEVEEEHDAEEVAQEQDTGTIPIEHNNIHPDRLKQATIGRVTEIDDDSNANYTALARDRGFNLTVPTSATRGPFPLLFSTGDGSINDGVPDFFPTAIDLDLVKSRWEEQRLELTQDWKRKRREGTKKMRKAKARRS